MEAKVGDIQLHTKENLVHFKIIFIYEYKYYTYIYSRNVNSGCLFINSQYAYTYIYIHSGVNNICYMCIYFTATSIITQYYRLNTKLIVVESRNFAYHARFNYSVTNYKYNYYYLFTCYYFLFQYICSFYYSCSKENNSMRLSGKKIRVI